MARFNHYVLGLSLGCLLLGINSVFSAVLEGQNGEKIIRTEFLYNALLSPDGNYIVTAGMDGIAMVDTDTGEKVKDIISTKPGQSTPGLVSFSGQGNQIWLSRGDTMILWDIDKAVEIASYTSAFYYSARLITGDGNFYYEGVEGKDSFKIWDGRTKGLLAEIPIPISKLTSLSVSKDRQYILTNVGTVDSTIQLWDAKTSALLSSISTNYQSSKPIFSPDSKYAYIFATEKLILIDLFQEMDFFFPPLRNNSTLSADGKFIVNQNLINYNSPETEIHIISTETFATTKTFDGPAFLGRLCLSDDGNSLLITGTSKAELWDIPKSKRVCSYGESYETTYLTAISPDQNLVAIADINNIHIIDTHSGKRLFQHYINSIFPTNLTLGFDMKFSPNSAYLAMGSKNGEVQVWDIWNDRIILDLQDLFGYGFDFSADSASILTPGLKKDSSNKMNFTEWDIKSGNVLRQYTMPNLSLGGDHAPTEYPASVIRFSPDNQQVLAIQHYFREKMNITLFKRDTAEVIKNFEAPATKHYYYDAIFNSDGKYILAMDIYKMFYWINIDSGLVEKSFSTPKYEFPMPRIKLFLLPDQHHFIAVFSNGAITEANLWDMNSGIKKKLFDINFDYYTQDIDLSNDGKILVVPKKEEIDLWDMDTLFALSATNQYQWLK